MSKQQKIKKQIKRIARSKNYYGLIGGEDLNANSKNIEKYVKQYKQRGFDDSEIWNLDMSLSLFLLPRLKRLREVIQGYPPICKSFEEWISILDEIIWMFETYSSDEYQNYEPKNKQYFEEVNQRIEKASELLGKYWTYFWD